MKRAWVLFLLLFWFTPAWAQPAPQWQMTLLGQGVAYDGNRSQFWELTKGAHSGLFLGFSYRSRENSGSTWDLQGQLFPEDSGWLRARGREGAWRVRFNFASLNAYSVVRLGEERFPLGLPASMPPVLASDEPSSRLSWGLLALSRDLGPGELTLELSGRWRDGDRVPEFGNVGFADNGTPAFYPMGICNPVSQAGGAALSWRGTWNRTSLRVALGAEEAKERENCALLAVGRTVLDTNEFAFRNDGTRRWAELEAQQVMGKLALWATGSLQVGDNTPSGWDRRVAGTGHVPGYTLQGGDGRFNVTGGTVAGRYALSKTFSLTLGVSAQHRFTRGEGELATSGTSYGVFQRRDLSRQGGRAQLAGRLGKATVRLSGEFFSAQEELSRTYRRNLVGLETDVETWRARAEVSVPKVLGFGVRGWAAYQEDSLDHTLNQLDWGYLPVVDARRNQSFGVSARRQLGAGFLRLGWTRNQSRSTLLEPFFEPIYDPTQVFDATAYRRFQERATAAFGLSGKENALSVELGYLRDRFDFDAGRPFPELAPVGEELTGLVAAVSWEWQWQEKVRLNATGEWVASRQVIHNRLLRGQVDLAYRLGGGWHAYGRLGYGDLSWTKAPSREFTGEMVAVGLHWLVP